MVKEQSIRNDEASTEENENLGGYHYSAESEDEFSFERPRRKDRKMRDSESSGPSPNANDLSTKNFEKEEGNVLKERLKLFHQPVKDSSPPAKEAPSPPSPPPEAKPLASKRALSSDDHVTSNIDSTHSVSEFEPTT